MNITYILCHLKLVLFKIYFWDCVNVGQMGIFGNGICVYTPSMVVCGVFVANTHSFFTMTVARRLTAITVGALRYCIAIAPLSTTKPFSVTRPMPVCPRAQTPGCPDAQTPVRPLECGRLTNTRTALEFNIALRFKFNHHTTEH